MNMLLNTVLQEKSRIDFMIERYTQEMCELPKGSISEKKINGNTYYYLKYRDGKKVISEYINKDSIDRIREQIDKRRHIESMLSALREEESMAMKILEE